MGCIIFTGGVIIRGYWLIPICFDKEVELVRSTVRHKDNDDISVFAFSFILLLLCLCKLIGIAKSCIIICTSVSKYSYG